MGRSSRNRCLEGGISRYSRSAMYRRRAIYKKKKVSVKAPAKKRTYYKVKEIKGEKNGEKRVVLKNKASRYYPTEDVPRKLHSRKKPQPPKLRDSIAPGTVLILLAGRHMGKRVIFLKQLESGLLLITGPYNVNGTPLRRVDQAYVIATKTKVDISTVKIPKELNDNYFKRTKAEKKSSGEIFSDSKKGYNLTDDRKEMVKSLDSQLLPLICAVPKLRLYLNHQFTLSHGQYPHNMVF